MAGRAPPSRARSRSPRRQSAGARSPSRASLSRDPRAAMPVRAGSVSVPKPSQPRSIAGRPSRRSSGSRTCSTTIVRSSASALSRARTGGLASGHRRAGQTSVIGSTTAKRWLRRKSVNRLRGWCVEVGRSSASGSSPVTCAGMASDVLSATVVALRYQVASAASSARLGKQLGVDRSAAHDRRHRQLVEHDVHDRRRRARPGRRPRPTPRPSSAGPTPARRRGRRTGRRAARGRGK